MSKALGRSWKHPGYKPEVEANRYLGVQSSQAWSKPVRGGESEAHKERKRKAHYPASGVAGTAG